MNFLAHIFLSNNLEPIILGNILEDFVVGNINHPRNDGITAEIKKGIQLHRYIDSMTDSHPATLECKKLLYPNYGKYASVLVDIFFDHFLTIHWKKFSNQSLEFCCENAYQVFQKNYDICPPNMQRLIDSMLKFRWLGLYGTKQGIENSLKNVASRALPGSKMEEGMIDLELHFEAFEANFLLFFPELKAMCDSFLKENC
jgi:acyl carrier protein phosphodiesterase